MLMAAFFAAAVAARHRLGLARLLAAHRRRRGAGAAARLRLHHLARQPGGDRRGDQHPGRRPDHRAGQRLVPARRPDARRLRSRADQRLPADPVPARSPATTSWSMSRSLVGAAHLVGDLRAPASACGCAPSARIRRRSTPPASRWPGCAIARCCCAACSARHRRRLSVDRPERRLQPRHDGGPGLHRAGRLIFGKWRPFPAFGACLLFGLLDAVAIRLQGVRLPGSARCRCS